MPAARRQGRTTLKELAVEVRLDCGSVSNTPYRIERRLARHRAVRREWEKQITCDVHWRARLLTRIGGRGS